MEPEGREDSQKRQGNFIRNIELADEIEIENPKGITTLSQYIEDQLKEINLWEFDSDIEEQEFRALIEKQPQLYEKTILGQFGKRSQKLLRKLKQDQTFLSLLERVEVHPLHEQYRSMKKQMKEEDCLFLLKTQIKRWEVIEILANNQKMITKEIEKALTKSKQLGDYLCQVYGLIEDTLIRKGNLNKIIEIINRVALKKGNELLSKISLLDFITLTIRILPKPKIHYLGILLHNNSLPIPLYTSLQIDGSHEQYPHPQILQLILENNNFKLICNIGTGRTERKGKTELIKGIFNLPFQSSVNQFHKSCIDLYTVSKVGVMIADFHGDIKNFKCTQLISKLLEHSCLIILNLDHTEEHQRQNIKSTIPSVNESNQLIFLRDCPENSSKNYSSQCHYLSNMEKSDGKAKQNVYSALKDAILSTIQAKKQFIQLKFLGSHKQEEKIEMKQVLNKEILNIIKESYDEDGGNLWEKCFPHLSEFRKICDLKNEMLELEQEIKYQQKDERHKKWQRMGKELQQRRNSQKTSEDVSYSPIAKFYAQNFQQIDSKALNKVIFEWKKDKTTQLQQELIDYRIEYQKKGDNKQLKDQILQKQQQYQQLDISADTVVQELIVSGSHNNDAYARCKECITEYYKYLHRLGNQINLIDGSTLDFGNSFLKQFIEEIGRQIPNSKKVYVVSVIGMQSSAKSTLMNYLFNCRFETSAGRCTKGVYFTICQTQRQVVIVIDTEGLMSVNARDQVFDIQITTFIFLISDLVLLNNKGEINAPIRELIGVCTYVLEQLHQSQSKKTKSKILFAIRDQSNVGVKEQQQMILKIMETLKENSDLANFKDYLDFDGKDVYPLESAFNHRITQNRTQDYPNQCFSELILAMRSNIFEYLSNKDPHYNSLFSFYEESSKAWLTIKECGKHIFNYREVLEIKIKQALRGFQQEILQRQSARIQEQYQILIAETRRATSKQDLQIIKSKANNLKDDALENIKNYLKDQSKSISGVKSEWVQHLYKECKRNFNDKNLMLGQILNLQYRKNLAKSKEEMFKQRILEIINNIFKSQKDLPSILEMYEKECMALLENKEHEYGDQQLIIKETFAKEIKQVINKSCLMPRNPHKDHGYLDNFKYFYHQGKFAHIQKKEKAQLKNILYIHLKCLQETIIPWVNDKFQPTENVHNSNFIREYWHQIAIIRGEVEKDIKSYSRSWHISSIGLNQSRFESEALHLLIDRFPSLVQKNRKKKEQRAKKQKKEAIEEKKKEIIDNFTLKGKISDVRNYIIRKYRESIFQELYESALTNLQDQMNSISLRFDPVKMIGQAMRLTFKSTQDGKVTWIKCLKVIKNFNKFLSEQILYQQPECLKLQHEIDNQKKIALEKIDGIVERGLKKQIKDLRMLGESLKIEIETLLHPQNEKNFNRIWEGLFTEVHLSDIKGWVRNQVNNPESRFKQLKQKVDKYIRDVLSPVIIGCQLRCPLCNMKCKLSRGHDGGHECVEGSHLQECFGRVTIRYTNERSLRMCFTQHQINNALYQFTFQDGQSKMIPTLKLFEKAYPEWLGHFKKGPYQDRMNQLNCERIWANIGDVIISHVYTHMINANVKKEYINNPLTQEDVKDWIHDY